MIRFTKILTPAFLILLLMIVSGCGSQNSGLISEDVKSKSEVENQVSDNEEQKKDNEWNRQEIDISKQLTFFDNGLGFGFNYPEGWEYKINKSPQGNIKVVFNSRNRERELVIDKPIPQVGLEMWKRLESEIINLDASTNAQLINYESNIDPNSRMMVLHWEKAKINNFQDDKINSDNDSVWLYIPDYDKEEISYYNDIMNLVIETLNF